MTFSLFHVFKHNRNGGARIGRFFQRGASSNSKIYELRSYAVKPPHLREHIQLIEEHLHLRTWHSKLFGFWNVELGALNELIHLWEFDSHDHRVEVRKAIANDDKWQSGFIRKVQPMWTSQTNATLKLMPWSTLRLPKKTGVYELQTFHLNSYTGETFRAAMELCSTKLRSSSTLVACYTTLYGQHNTVYALWQHESYDHLVLENANISDEESQSIMREFLSEVKTSSSKGLVPLQLYECGEDSIHSLPKIK